MTMPDHSPGPDPANSLQYYKVGVPSDQLPVLAAIRVMGATVEPLGADPTVASAESHEVSEPIWVGADDFKRWAATQEDYSESGGSYFGTRAWKAVLRVAVDASVHGKPSPLVLSRYPDDLSTWERYLANRDEEFGQLDLQSMAGFVAQIRQEAGSRTGKVLETFINDRLPGQVGFVTYQFWDRFTHETMAARNGEQHGGEN